MYFDENGWPSVTSPGVQNNSIYAVANVENEMDYYLLLGESIYSYGRLSYAHMDFRLEVRVFEESHRRRRGLVLAYVGVLAPRPSYRNSRRPDIYSDNMEPGYGLYNETGRQKFPFTPKTHC
jgi:hypothetical protein